jgi:hypothetical protein
MIEIILFALVLLLILAGGINELVYFNRLCGSTKQGYDDLRKDIEELL